MEGKTFTPPAGYFWVGFLAMLVGVLCIMVPIVGLVAGPVVGISTYALFTAAAAVPVFVILLICGAILNAITKALKVTTPSWKKAYFMLSIMLLMGSFSKLIGGSQSLYWILTIIAAVLWIMLARRVYALTIGKAIGLWALNFLSLLVVIFIFGILSTVVLTTMMAAKGKAMQAQTSESVQLPQ